MDAGLNICFSRGILLTSDVDTRRFANGRPSYDRFILRWSVLGGKRFDREFST